MTTNHRHGFDCAETSSHADYTPRHANPGWDTPPTPASDVTEALSPAAQYVGKHDPAWRALAYGATS